MTDTPANAEVRPLVAGNWKMNGISAALEEARAVDAFVTGRAGPDRLRCDVMICPPATLIHSLADDVKAITVGAQDCHTAETGAHTGDLSAEMMADVGATAVIVGHSERRADHGETDAIVRRKTEAVFRAGLTAIVCIGETIGQRNAGLTLKVLARQLANSLPDTAKPDTTIIAYEPVWAIGTGVTPTPDDVAEVHTALRGHLVQRFGADGARFRLLYGGSVKPSNAAELMSVPNVDGALVGGASLKAADFTGIISVYGAKAGAAVA